jgi:hypothetical protein
MKYYNKVKISNLSAVMENLDINGDWESYYTEYYEAIQTISSIIVSSTTEGYRCLF